jgi:outer membrane protein OmpA-like peptidoglycan-associated protein
MRSITEITHGTARYTALLAGLAMLGCASLAHAQSASETQIFEALKPKGVTRGLSIGAPAPAAVSEESAFIDSLRSRAPRTYSTLERNKLAEISSTQPSIDLDIPFDFNSTTVGPKAVSAVKSLGAALARPEMKGGTFLIAGHTDGKGSDEFNLKLSERRAEAVKQYLVENFNLAPESLLIVGYGESRLKAPSNPLANENRRVQATNLTEIKTTSR